MQPEKLYGFIDFFSNSSLPLKHLFPSFATIKLRSDSLKTTTTKRGPNISTSDIILFVKSLKMESSN